jgi:hypothetical protein
MFILNLNSSVSSIIVPSPVTSSVLPIVCAVQTNMLEEGGGQENDVTDNTEKGDFARVSFELLFVLSRFSRRFLGFLICWLTMSNLDMNHTPASCTSLHLPIKKDVH